LKVGDPALDISSTCPVLYFPSKDVPQSNNMGACPVMSENVTTFSHMVWGYALGS
jgi:hypothetical protein